MPTDQPEIRAATTQHFIDESFGYLKRINPALTTTTGSPSRSAACATPSRSASRASPPSCRRSDTPIAGLQIADTCFYYPEDRGISEGARLAKEMAMAIGTDHVPRREPSFV